MTGGSSSTNNKKPRRCNRIATLGFVLLFLRLFRHHKLIRPTKAYQKSQRYFQSTAVRSVFSMSSNPSPQSPRQVTQPSGCWRHCPQRINKIFYTDAGAGMGDRSVIIHTLGNLAGYLCATVELPPPWVLLTPLHNGNKKLDKRVVWGDFFNYTFLRDDSQVVHEAKDNPNFQQGFKGWKKVGIYKKKHYPGWQVLLTKAKGGSIINDYRKAQELSWKQDANATKGFIWEIHRQIYGSRLVKVAPLPGPSSELREMIRDSYNESMRPYLRSWKKSVRSKGANCCNYIDRRQSVRLRTLTRELQDRVRSMAPPDTSIFGFLHIRRNDAKKECDTSIDKLRSFFQCSLNGTETTGKHITFLMGSDEKNQNYRKDVLDMAKEYPHVSMLDADKIVKDFMNDMLKAKKMPPWLMNNFHLFELMKAIGLDRSNFVSINLVQRRRAECPRCSSLMKEFPNVWA